MVLPKKDGGDLRVLPADVESGGRIPVMSKRIVRFIAVKTEKKPTTVKFKTKSGKTVSFKATKNVKVNQVVRFPAKKK